MLLDTLKRQSISSSRRSSAVSEADVPIRVQLKGRDKGLGQRRDSNMSDKGDAFKIVLRHHSVKQKANLNV